MNLFSRCMVIAGCVGGAALSHAVTLYDGNGLPASQPWLSFNALPAGAYETDLGAGGVQLETSAPKAVYAGYSNYTLGGTLKNATFPALNAAPGFSLAFSVNMISETHNDAANTTPPGQERAGFSVILTGQDKVGIEIGFRPNEVFSQPTSFLGKKESASFSASGAHDYVLQIAGGTYRLFADNSLVLTGATVDYSAFGAPYSLSNLVFLGDNTSESGAKITMGRVELNPVPEPSIVVGLSAGLAILVRRRKR